jgi:hypothetical protein
MQLFQWVQILQSSKMVLLRLLQLPLHQLQLLLHHQLLLQLPLPQSYRLPLLLLAEPLLRCLHWARASVKEPLHVGSKMLAIALQWMKLF